MINPERTFLSCLLDSSRSSARGCLHRIVCNESQSQSQHVFLASQLRVSRRSQGLFLLTLESQFSLPPPPDVVHSQPLNCRHLSKDLLETA
ncbi:hypothetical protein PDIP_56330 [Penicillium digitatum Pd1]|uniref:Uncharacterized protein n=1 Tax=Penicillium digitatum (strain Pd1 / CECT 20795) TaxID=1170230 RepID=K9FSM0_PEND1|nr:hypothetical protein PDIP_56330 [Penicillium digitatum Pd1]EKV11447.1 hypothetical protein PDIP_56330 [Penicillium digitatum Pd1]